MKCRYGPGFFKISAATFPNRAYQHMTALREAEEKK
jgi:hypothetical protein